MELELRQVTRDFFGVNKIRLCALSFIDPYKYVSRFMMTTADKLLFINLALRQKRSKNSMGITIKAFFHISAVLIKYF